MTGKHLPFIFIVVSAGCWGQSSRTDPCAVALQRVASTEDVDEAQGYIEQRLAFVDEQPCMAFLLVQKQIANSRVRVVQKSLQGRLNNQQLSSSTAPQGTTSPLSKPATSALSLVSEYGGVTTSTQNQTTTLAISPYKPLAAIAKEGWIPYCDQALAISRDCISYQDLNWLNRLSLGVTANTSTSAQKLTASPTSGTTSTGSTQAVTATSSSNKAPSFAGATGKFVLLYSKGQSTQSGQKGKTNLPDFSKLDYSTANGRLGMLYQDLEGNKLFKQWQTCIKADLDGIWVNPSATPKALKPAADRQIAIEAALEDYEKIVDVLRLGSPVTTCKSPSTLNGLAAADIAAAQAFSAKFIKDLPAAIAALDQIQEQVDAAILATMTTPALSLEYDFSTPANQPSNSTTKLVWSYIHTTKTRQTLQPASPGCPTGQTGSKGASANSSTVACPSWTLTLNGGLSWYSSTPSSAIPGSSLLRDTQAGIELDKNIYSSKWGKVGTWIGDTTLSGAYYYQDQTSPSILNATNLQSPVAGITLTGVPSTATQVFTQKGNINFFQLKWGFGTGTNVKFPIAVSWSNRSELIAHPTWGAQFGVSYDFTSLLGSSGNGKSP